MDHPHHRGHACGHEHAHKHESLSSGRYLLLALLTAIGVGVQGFGTLTSGSLSLGADTVHILADCALYFLAWREALLEARGGKFTSRKAALGVASGRVLVVSGTCTALIGAYLLLLSGNRPESSAMFYPTLIGLGINIAMACILSGMHGGVALRAAVVHNALDLASSLVVVAVMLGGVYLPEWTYLPKIDPLASIIVGCLLIWIGSRVHVH